MIKERKPNRLKGYDYSSDNLYFVTSCVHNRICCFGEIVPGNRASSVAGTGRHRQKMILNEYGKIAEKQWYWLQEQYPYIVLHAFVVMPNHIHGIIEINRGHVGTGRDPSLPRNDDIPFIGTNRDPSLPRNDDIPFIGTGRDIVVGTGRDIVVGTGRDIVVGTGHDIVVGTGRDIVVGTGHDIVVGTGHDIVVGTGHDIVVGTGHDPSLRQTKIKSLSELIGAYKTTVSKQIHLTGFIEFQWQRSFYEHIIRDEKSFETISDYILNNPNNWKQDNHHIL